jgi:hypothetical protein
MGFWRKFSFFESLGNGGWGWREFSLFEDFRYGDSASLRIVLHFALKTDNGRHVFLIQAFDFELYMYGVAGSLLGKVLNATETTTLASKWNPVVSVNNLFKRRIQ